MIVNILFTIFLGWFLYSERDKEWADSQIYACLTFVVLLAAGAIIWDLLGLSSGIGGNPYGDY